MALTNLNQLKEAAKRAKSRPAMSSVMNEPYSESELEFMKALDWYKREFDRPFPTCSEVLAVLRYLGYAKTPSLIKAND